MIRGQRQIRNVVATTAVTAIWIVAANGLETDNGHRAGTLVGYYLIAPHPAIQRTPLQQRLTPKREDAEMRDAQHHRERTRAEDDIHRGTVMLESGGILSANVGEGVRVEHAVSQRREATRHLLELQMRQPASGIRIF